MNTFEFVSGGIAALALTGSMVGTGIIDYHFEDKIDDIKKYCLVEDDVQQSQKRQEITNLQSKSGYYLFGNIILTQGLFTIGLIGYYREKEGLDFFNGVRDF